MPINADIPKPKPVLIVLPTTSITATNNPKATTYQKEKYEQTRFDLDPLDRNYDLEFDSFTSMLDEMFDSIREVERIVDTTEDKIRNAHNAKKNKEEAIQFF